MSTALKARGLNVILENDGVKLAAQARGPSLDLLIGLAAVARGNIESPIGGALLGNVHVGARGVLEILEEWWDEHAPPVEQWALEFRLPPWWPWALRIVSMNGRFSRSDRIAEVLFSAPSESDVAMAVWGSLLDIPDLNLEDLEKLLLVLVPPKGRVRVFTKALQTGQACALLQLGIKRAEAKAVPLSVADVWAAAMMSPACRQNDLLSRDLRALTSRAIDSHDAVLRVCSSLKTSSEALDIAISLETRYAYLRSMQMEPEENLGLWLDKAFPFGIPEMVMSHAMESPLASFRQWALLSLGQRCRPGVATERSVSAGVTGGTGGGISWGNHSPPSE